MHGQHLRVNCGFVSDAESVEIGRFTKSGLPLGRGFANLRSMASYQKTIALPGYTKEQIFSSIHSGIDNFLNKNLNLPVKFDVEIQKESHSVDLKSSFAQASLVCRDGEVELKGHLSLMALPFRGKIDQGIETWTKKLFPNA